MEAGRHRAGGLAKASVAAGPPGLSLQPERCEAAGGPGVLADLKPS